MACVEHDTAIGARPVLRRARRPERRDQVGETLAGILVYHDEFTIGMRDASGSYHSWRVEDVKYKIDAPVEAHVALFGKYSDDDIHNLMAYIQTLR